MAASDKFESFNEAISGQDRVQLTDFMKSKREEIFAARSEDARVRLVNEYLREVNQRLHRKK